MISREKLNRYIGLYFSLALLTGFLDNSDYDYPEVVKLENTVVSHWVADTSQVRKELETLTKLQNCEIDRDFHGETYRNCPLEANWPSRAYKDALPEIRATVPQILQKFNNQSTKQSVPKVAAPSIEPIAMREDVLEYLTYLNHVTKPKLQMRIYIANGALLLLALLVFYKRELAGSIVSNLFLWLVGFVKKNGRQIHERI